MKKTLHAFALLIMLAVAALTLAACQPPPPADRPQAEPSPTPPPIPTDVPTEETEAPQPEGSDAQEATSEPLGPRTAETAGNAGVIIYGSIRDGAMGLRILSGTGLYSMPLELDDDLDHVTWPAVSPDGEKLAFVAVEGSAAMPSRGLYVADIDGGNAERIVRQDARYPRWSPDGTQIAYTCNGGADVCVVGADGEGNTNLTEDSTGTDQYADWMPGGEIVFMSNRNSPDGRASDIFIMNADGSNVRNLTNSAADDGFPSVSPDGLRIAFTSDRSRDNGVEVFVLETRTGLVRQVTVDDLWNQNPIWAPDNQTILFGAPDETGSVNLYSIGDRDISAQQMTKNPAEDGGLRLGHAWLPEPLDLEDREREATAEGRVSLPDGSAAQPERILFGADDTGCAACLEAGIYLVDGNGDNLERLPVEGSHPTWAPDHRRLAYARDGELFVANADGSGETQVTRSFADLSAPDWNDDGSALVAQCRPYEQADVCVVDVQQGTVSVISARPSLDEDLTYPWWWADDIVAGTQIMNRAGDVKSRLPSAGRVSPDGQRFATIVDREVAVTGISGGSRTIVSDGPATKAFPVWSPAGDRVLYTVAPGDGRLYLNVARATGGYAFRLIPEAIAPGPRGTPPVLDAYYGYSWGP